MDISEFLASMQQNAPDRALARNTHMGIPDADNDPSTPDAGGGQDLGSAQAAPEETSQEVQDDDMQQFAEGGEVLDGASRDGDKVRESRHFLPDSKESENIEDRRGEPAGADPNGGDAFEGYKQGLVSQNRQSWGRTADKLGALKFNDGGEVPDEEAADASAQGGEGAIPDNQGGSSLFGQQADEPPQQTRQPKRMGRLRMPEQAAPAEVGSGDQEGNAKGSDSSDWVSKAIDYGYNILHGVNRAIGGAQDPEQSSQVGSMLKGQGALNPQQWEQAMASANPDGALDESSTHLKVIGELGKFYGATDPQQGAAAGWGAIQHLRRQYDHMAALATHADDMGSPEKAAEWATKAFNKSLDGVQTQIKALPVNMQTIGAGQKQRPGAPLGGNVSSGAEATAGGISHMWTPDQTAGQAQHIGAEDDGSTPAQPATGIPDGAQPTGGGAMPSSPGVATEQAPPPAPSAGGGSQGPLNSWVPNSIDGNPAAGYQVTQTDPESGKVIYTGQLTSEQLKHALADGFDRVLNKGSTAQLENASKVTEGHGHMGGGARAQAPQAPGGGNQSRAFDHRVPIQHPSNDPRMTNSAAARDLPAPKYTPGPPEVLSPREGQDHAELNGLPKGMNIRGMSIGQISRLRQQYAEQQIKEHGHNTRQEGHNQSQERIANQRYTTQKDVAGMPARPNTSAPGQQEATHRSVLTHAQKDTTDWLNQQLKRPDQAAIDAFTADRVKYWSQAGRGQAQQSNPVQDNAHPDQTHNGRTYKWNPNAISPKTGKPGAYVGQ